MTAYLIAGLAFGDEGKGACVDALTRHLPVDLIVRYNGGCQAAHHVVLPDGRSHCFSQFGAGMLANSRVKTHLSRFMLVEPFAMMNEACALETLGDEIWKRTTVDGNAVVVTPFHRELNRLREEALGNNRHGSCGRGIGAARETHLKYGDKVLLARDVQTPSKCREKLYFLADELAPERISLELRLRKQMRLHQTIDSMVNEYKKWPARIVDGFEPAETMVFEGAQGVMLDEKHGTAPHNTWTNTTFENADTLLDEAGVSILDRRLIGCLRSYHTRHGAGPFPTEDNTLDLPEPHNGNSGFQGPFRVGKFDFNLALKAINIAGGIHYLAISHLDYLPRLGLKEDNFLEAVREFTPICMQGRGPTAEHRTIDLEVCV